jgi:hypothetical protein
MIFLPELLHFRALFGESNVIILSLTYLQKKVAQASLF